MDPDSKRPLLNAEWRLANPAAERALAGSSTLRGMRLLDICAWQDKTLLPILDRWERQLGEQGRFSWTVPCVWGGQPSVFAVEAVLDGENLLVWFRDITAEHQEVASLQRDQELLRTVIHSAPDAIFAKDVKGHYTLINPAGARAIGMPSEQILGRTDSQLFLPSDAEATLAHDREVLSLGHPMTYEDEDLGGERIWQSTKGVLRDDRGAVAGLFGISRDITERRRMEKALQDSELRYRLVAEATRDVIWDWNVFSNELEWISARGEVFGGTPRRGLSSLSWWKERIHPEDRPRELDLLQEVMKSQKDSWTSEYRFRRADGSYAVVLERGHISRDLLGRPERLIATMMDVSEHKQREEQKAGEARMLERFMAILGHDLGSPLSAIRIMSQVMQRDTGLSSSHRTFLSRIESSSARAARLTHQLLDSVLARNGGIPIQPRPINLEPLCRRVLEELRVIYPQHTLQLDVTGETQGCWDPDRLAQAISNLVGNALEHGAPGGAISIRLRGVRDMQVLEVNNHGVPIPPSMMPHLFDPFWRGTSRLPEPMAHSGGGVGLGLFIVREIARVHGGEVTVDSSPRDGTTFGLLLPRSPRAAALHRT
ncbi:MAG: ATP-binding protein [Cystobacter sp.]